MTTSDFEFHQWPIAHIRGGQHTNGGTIGVLVVHVATGVAFLATEGRSQFANRLLGIDEVTRLVEARKGRG